MFKDLTKLSTRTNLNSSAMVAEKLLGICINVIVFAVMARYLGPQKFGLFALLQAAFTIGFPVAMVVSEEIMLKFQVGQKSDVRSLQNSALKLKFSSSIVVYIATATLAFIFFEKEVFVLVAAFGLLHLVNFDLIYNSYFRAIEMSQLVFWLKVRILIPFGILKVCVAVLYPDLLLIVGLFVAEALALSVISKRLFKVHFSRSYDDSRICTTSPSQLLKASWPVFTAALLVTLYTRVDQFMIELYLSREQLGLYSAASKLSESSQHVLVAILLSRFPNLLKLQDKSRVLFEQAIVNTMRACIIPWSAIVIFLFFYADSVITIIFGVEYVPASTTLIVLLSSTIFVYYGVVCTQWLLTENLQIYRLYRVFAALLLNIILNVWLIPIYGIEGAAYATIVSQACSSVLFNAAHPKTRAIFKLQVRTLWPFLRA